jgi:hypothetical protein
VGLVIPRLIWVELEFIFIFKKNLRLNMIEYLMNLWIFCKEILPKQALKNPN